MHEITPNSIPLTGRRNQNVYLFVISSITQLLIGRGKLDFKPLEIKLRYSFYYHNHSVWISQALANI